MSMRIVTSKTEMQNLALAARREGKRIAFVPTMGYLHEGHLSLMREGRKRGDLLVLSIFVNPTQFGAGEDFEVYPRDLDRDRLLAASAGVEVIFAPQAEEMYPSGYQSFVDVERLTLPLCGANRPGHFRGVTSVVAKLFNIVKPDVALFGNKDYQQLTVIRRMTADLDFGIEIVGMPIVREADGLAMSSRNARLSPDERKSALCLSRTLSRVKEVFAGGERRVEPLRSEALRLLALEPAAAVDYLEFRDGATLEEIDEAGGGTVVALAVKIGTTRLIDNCLLGEEEDHGT